MGLLAARDIAAMQAVINGQANATVTQLEEPGALADNGDPTYTVRWTGSAPALLARREKAATIRGFDGQSVRLELADIDRVDTLTILDGTVPIVEQAGPSWIAWRVTVQDNRTTPSVTRSFQITSAKHDAPGLIDSVVLELANQR